MSTPLFQQIKQYIVDKIESGEWQEGHKITTELALTNQFNVSRMTVNKAIRDLVVEGRLYRKPRNGTFVCNREKADSSLLNVHNIAKEVGLRGKKHKSLVIKQIALNADPEVSIKLAIHTGARCFYSEIIHLEDDTPIQLEMRWVNAEYVPEYISQNFLLITANEYLLKVCQLSDIEHTVEAVKADAYVCKALSMEEHEPCLVLNRRTWSGTRIISVAVFYHPGSRYRLSAKIKVN